MASKFNASFKKTIIALVYLAVGYAFFAYVYNNFFTQTTTFPRESVTYDLTHNTDYLQQKDTINILVVAGGGVRGLIPLHVLQYIEDKLGKPLDQVFDVFSGVSTGAIIATGLNIPDEAIPSRNGQKLSHLDYLVDIYENEVNYLFSPPWYHKFLTAGGLFSPSYFGSRLHEVMEKHYTKDLNFTELENYVIIPSLNLKDGQIHLFKNKGETVNYLPTDRLYQLMTAAVSAETAFPPVVFNYSEDEGIQHCEPEFAESENESQCVFADAAIAMNNPASMILRDVINEFPDKNYYILVLGAGSPRLLSSTTNYDTLKNWGQINWFRDALTNMQRSMDTHQLHTLEIAKSLSEEGRIEYDYLNIEIREPFIGIFEHKKLPKLKDYSDQLIKDNQAQIDLIIDHLKSESIKNSSDKS
ncbi:patatin-like phospholipase family protein [Microbulbifer sp. EKSA005]|uniref:patatin-like phospholipase family protein n=1 Tax=Microbulbifer sp. EKSA005 TaxID=3243364 RepID=UPI0040423BDF